MGSTPLAELLAAEIETAGPIPFSRFMEVALYNPELGYYRRERDPFGKGGDYYTAEQLQPVFGLTIAAYIRDLQRQMGPPADFTVVELGAGRGEMAEFLSEFPYIPVDVGKGEMPAQFTGVVFANELFDALPVDLAVKRGEGFREMRVGLDGERFIWVEADGVDSRAAEYLRKHLPSVEEGFLAEINMRAQDKLDEIASHLVRGFLFAIDYGYTRREVVRFPAGTLMSYRRHSASEDVLSDPGSRDITAHVNFSALEEHAVQCGFRKVRFESLAMALLRAGEADQFASAIEVGDEPERLRRRLQLKTLLFGMGETFRTLLLEKTVTK